MPATNFPEYAREIEGVLDAAVAAGEVVLVSIQIDQRSYLRGFITGVLQFNDASGCTSGSLWTPVCLSPG